MEKKPICEECRDAARKSLDQEIREGLKKRNLYCGPASADLITAIFFHLDKKEEK